jgi:hypothetical protein
MMEASPQLIEQLGAALAARITRIAGLARSGSAALRRWRAALRCRSGTTFRCRARVARIAAAAVFEMSTQLVQQLGAAAAAGIATRTGRSTTAIRRTRARGVAGQESCRYQQKRSIHKVYLQKVGSGGSGRRRHGLVLPTCRLPDCLRLEIHNVSQPPEGVTLSPTEVGLP